MSPTINCYHYFVGHPQSGPYKNLLCEFFTLIHWLSLSATPGDYRANNQLASGHTEHSTALKLMTLNVNGLHIIKECILIVPQKKYLLFQIINSIAYSTQ